LNSKRHPLSDYLSVIVVQLHLILSRIKKQRINVKLEVLFIDLHRILAIGHNAWENAAPSLVRSRLVVPRHRDLGRAF
jgi:hypothetical protein